MAARDIPAGRAVRKYGQIIGFASSDIAAGDHVHTHNLEMGSFTRDHAIGVDAKPTPILPLEEQATFQGIMRPDGKVATRNYLGVLATVSCSSSVVRFIADALDEQELANYPNVDGIVALGHDTGCGVNST
jgi:altronate hydrolase